MKMKLTIIILGLLLAPALVYAGGYEVPFTKGYADNLYCPFGGCNFTSTISASDYLLHNGSSCCQGGASGVSSVTGTSPIVSSGGTNPDISWSPVNIALGWGNITNTPSLGNTTAEIRSVFGSSSNITYDEATGTFYYNGSIGSGGGGASPFTDVDNVYIYNATGTLTFNETKLNNTILSNDIWVNESGDTMTGTLTVDASGLWDISGGTSTGDMLVLTPNIIDYKPHIALYGNGDGINLNTNAGENIIFVDDDTGFATWNRGGSSLSSNFTIGNIGSNRVLRVYSTILATNINATTINIETLNVTDNIIATGNITGNWGNFNYLNVTGTSYLGSTTIEAETIVAGFLNGSWNGSINYYTKIETNETIDQKLAGTQYNATVNYTRYGTPSSVPENDISYTWAYDSDSYNITISAGANALEHYMNFTASDLNRVCMRTRFISNNPTSSIIQVDIWDTSLNSWEAYGDLAPTSDFDVKCFPVFDPLEHIVNGVVPVRFIMIGNGVTGQKFLMDFVWLLDGYTPIFGTEVDPLSLHKDGNVEPTGNFNWDGYTIYNVNINGSWNGSVNYPTNLQFDNNTIVRSHNTTWITDNVDLSPYLQNDTDARHPTINTSKIVGDLNSSLCIDLTQNSIIICAGCGLC